MCELTPYKSCLHSQRFEAVLRDPRRSSVSERNDVRETETGRRQLPRAQQMSGTQGRYTYHPSGSHLSGLWNANCKARREQASFSEIDKSVLQLCNLLFFQENPFRKRICLVFSADNSGSLASYFLGSHLAVIYLSVNDVPELRRIPPHVFGLQREGASGDESPLCF